MKKLSLVISLFLLLSIYSFAQTSEQVAIKKVCIDEQHAYNNFDYETWASYHVQTADEQLSWNEPNGSYGTQSGWEEISKGMKDWFTTAKKEDLKISNTDFIIVIRGDMAFATFNTTTETTAGKLTKMKDYRTLLHTNGKWKILAVQAYVNYVAGK